MKKDFSKYYLSLGDFLRREGFSDVKVGGEKFKCVFHNENTGSADIVESHGKQRYRCFGCNPFGEHGSGDIYDVVGLLRNISKKKEQYEYIERAFGGGYEPPPVPQTDAPEKEFVYDAESCAEFEKYVFEHPARDKAVRNYLTLRENGRGKYPPEVRDKLTAFFGYWPGIELARQELRWKILHGAGIPGDNPTTKNLRRGIIPAWCRSSARDISCGFMIGA